MIHLIVDGYNLIRLVPELRAFEAESLEAGRKALIRRLGEYRRFRAHPVTVVFDGVGGLGEAPVSFKEAGITVCFSSADRSADDVIRDMCARLRHAAVVVTSDRDLASAVRGCGGAAIEAKEFHERLRLACAGEVPPRAGSDPRPAHKRWVTYKRGNAKKLPKRERRNRNRLDKL